MYLSAQWRILTVGDGDLTFTRALKRRFADAHIVGSVYDSEAVLREKYSSHGIDELRQAKVPLYFSFDVTNQACWQRLSTGFDVIIFQFPLLSQLGSKNAFAAAQQQGGLNTLNRALLHQFLRHASAYGLAKHGAGLCYITSKDVKPYSHWGLDHALCTGLDIQYVGEQPFNIDEYPGYRIRNVDRNKHVKDTKGVTYSYALNPKNVDFTYHRPRYLDDTNYCPLCHAGPFCNEKDQAQHFESRQHQLMLGYQQHWQNWLAHAYKDYS